MFIISYWMHPRFTKHASVLKKKCHSNLYGEYFGMGGATGTSWEKT